MRAKRCWLCGDAWAPTRGGGDALCASFPLCGGRRPHGARNPRAGARAFGVELVPGLERFRLRCLPRPRGEPRDAIETLRGQARELGRATAMDCGGDWPTFPVQRLVEVERFLDAAWRRGEVRGVRKAPPAAVAAVRSKPLPITDADVAELLRDVPPALLETLAPFQRYGAAFALRMVAPQPIAGSRDSLASRDWSPSEARPATGPPPPTAEIEIHFGGRTRFP